MKKFFVIVIASFLATSAHADCGDMLIEMQEKEVGEISTAQIQCIKSDSLFLESLDGLCSSNKSELSEGYKKYLEYKLSYEAKIVERDNATSDSVRRALNSELYSIESEWQIYGYKWEMEPYIFALSSSISNCASNN